MDVRKLEVFCAVAEEGSFTAAATRLHMTQSAVSQQMAAFERELKVPLLRRHPRGVALTTAGAVLVARGRVLLGDAAALERDVWRMSEPQTVVGLGVFATAGAYLVPAVVREFRERHPDMVLRIQSCQPDQLATELAAGRIDVGLSWDYDFLARPMAPLHHFHLLDDPMRLVLPQGHPLAAEDRPLRLIELADQPWVERVHGAPYRSVIREMGRIAGFEPEIAFEAEDYQSVQGLVAAGVGVGLVPRLSLLLTRPDVVVRPIEHPSFVRRVDAVIAAGTVPSEPARLLIDLLEEATAPLGG